MIWFHLLYCLTLKKLKRYVSCTVVSSRDVVLVDYSLKSRIHCVSRTHPLFVFCITRRKWATFNGKFTSQYSKIAHLIWIMSFSAANNSSLSEKLSKNSVCNFQELGKTTLGVQLTRLKFGELRSETAYGAYENQHFMLHDKTWSFGLTPCWKMVTTWLVTSYLFSY